MRLALLFEYLRAYALRSRGITFQVQQEEWFARFASAASPLLSRQLDGCLCRETTAIGSRERADFAKARLANHQSPQSTRRASEKKAHAAAIARPPGGGPRTSGRGTEATKGTKKEKSIEAATAVKRTTATATMAVSTFPCWTAATAQSSSLGIAPPCSQAWSGVHASAAANNSQRANDTTAVAVHR